MKSSPKPEGEYPTLKFKALPWNVTNAAEIAKQEEAVVHHATIRISEKRKIFSIIRKYNVWIRKNAMSVVSTGGSFRIATAVAVLAVIVISLFAALEYAQVANLQRQNSSLESAVKSGNNSPATLAGALVSHLTKLESLNTSSALEDYAPNATMTVSGAASIQAFSGLPGTYTGADEITNALDFFFGNTTHYKTYLHTQSAHVTIESFNVTRLSDGNPTIKASLALVGESRVWGAFNATISASYQYTYQSNTWLISQEDWNFTYFHVQYPLTSGT